MSSRLVGFVVMLAPAAAYSQQVPNGYNGSWWASQPTQAQIAFLAGDSDCYVSDVKGNAYSNGGLSEDSARRVTEYLKAHPTERNSPLVAILRHVFAHDKHPRPTKKIIGSAEYWPEKHGFFDGNYWWQLGDLGGRAPYVAGYLSCEITFNHKRVTRPVAYYVRSVNRWYGTDGKDSDFRTDREDDKIANVIDRYLQP